jgi:hypothetical protein
MTEAEWQSCQYPMPMLEYLRGQASDRKLRLFACACQRRIWHLLKEGEAGRKLVQALEPYADGFLDADKLPALLRDSTAFGVAAICSRDAAFSSERLGLLVAAEEQQAHADLLRCIFGDPFKPLSIPPAVLAWLQGTVVKLATAIYEGRKWEDMPLLGDALEEAGVTDQAVLDHCRGPGPHARGCHVVDALLGRS